MFAMSKRRQSCVERVRLGLGCALGLSLGWAALPETAQACSRSIYAIAVSYPVVEASDVPTNVVLFADGYDLDELSFELLDEHGGSIPIQVRAVEAGGFDIEPSAELAPHQTYTLTVPDAPSGVIKTVTFMTGSGPRAVPEALAPPLWNPVMVSRDFGTCGPLYSYCTGARAARDTTLEGRIGRHSLSDWSTVGLELPGGGGLADGECLTLRTRDIRGHRSAPVTVCSDAIHRYDSGNGPDGPVPSIDCDAITSSFAEAPHDDDTVRPPPLELGSTPAPTDVVRADRVGGGRGVGCALALGPHGAAASWLALVGALAALARRRRRSVR